MTSSLILSVALLGAPQVPATTGELQFGFDQLVKSLAATQVVVKPLRVGARPSRGECIRLLGLAADQVIENAQFFPPPPPSFRSPNMAGLSAEEQSLLTKMMRWNLIDANSPLASQPGVPTPRDFGRVLGVFLAQSADLTHPVSTKYSPFLAK